MPMATLTVRPQLASVPVNTIEKYFFCGMDPLFFQAFGHCFRDLPQFSAVTISFLQQRHFKCSLDLIDLSAKQQVIPPQHYGNRGIGRICGYQRYPGFPSKNCPAQLCLWFDCQQYRFSVRILLAALLLSLTPEDFMKDCNKHFANFLRFEHRH